MPSTPTATRHAAPAPANNATRWSWQLRVPARLALGPLPFPIEQSSSHFLYELVNTKHSERRRVPDQKLLEGHRPVAAQAAADFGEAIQPVLFRHVRMTLRRLVVIDRAAAMRNDPRVLINGYAAVRA